MITGSPITAPCMVSHMGLTLASTFNTITFKVVCSTDSMHLNYDQCRRILHNSCRSLAVLLVFNSAQFSNGYNQKSYIAARGGS